MFYIGVQVGKAIQPDPEGHGKGIARIEVADADVVVVAIELQTLVDHRRTKGRVFGAPGKTAIVAVARNVVEIVIQR